MARTRQLGPQFFRDFDLCQLEPLARIAFEGLWVLADCKGRLRDKPAEIKVQVLPYDNADMEELLQKLAAPLEDRERGFIRRYEVGGRRYIQIENFEKYQTNVHPNEKKQYAKKPDEQIPAPQEDTGNRDFGVTSRDSGSIEDASLGDRSVIARAVISVPSVPSVPSGEEDFLPDPVAERIAKGKSPPSEPSGFEWAASERRIVADAESEALLRSKWEGLGISAEVYDEAKETLDLRIASKQESEPLDAGARLDRWLYQWRRNMTDDEQRGRRNGKARGPQSPAELGAEPDYGRDERALAERQERIMRCAEKHPGEHALEMLEPAEARGETRMYGCLHGCGLAVPESLREYELKKRARAQGARAHAGGAG